MAIKSRNKVNAQFSMSSMTDIVFLLLIFFMITSTMVHPNALKLLLPQSNSQVSAKPITTVSINRNLDFYIENTPIDFGRLEAALKVKFDGVPEEDRTVALHAEKSVPIDEVVKVMNIAKNTDLQLIGVNYKDTKVDGEKYLEVMGNPFDVIIFDPNGKIGMDLGVYATPETFLVNQDGVILYKHIGEIDSRVWEDNFAIHLNKSES